MIYWLNTGLIYGGFVAAVEVNIDVKKHKIAGKRKATVFHYFELKV